MHNITIKSIKKQAAHGTLINICDTGRQSKHLEKNSKNTIHHVLQNINYYYNGNTINGILMFQ